MRTLVRQLTNFIVDQRESRAFNVCSRWAVKYRRMQGGKKYSIARFPYVREIMDTQAKYNWIKKGAQTGLSETAITLTLFTTIREGRDVIYYFPTKSKMTEFSSSRIDDAIILSPFITAACTMKNRDLKRFGAASAFMLGANSDSDLKSTSAGRLIMDEFDEWTPKAVYLALERTSGQLDKDVKVWGFSTPTLPDVGIDLKFKDSTQEWFFFDCPHCGDPIALEWDVEEKTGRHCLVLGDNPADAYYRCWKCDKELPHEHKATWLASGRFMAMDSDGNPVEPDAELKRLNRGFYVPQMYSPGVTPEEFSIKWLRGVSGDLDAMREFHNSAVGEPFMEGSHRVTDAHLLEAKRAEKYSTKDIGPISAKEHFVTLGVDQGGPVHHWVAVSWKFVRGRFGDPNDRAVGKIIGLGRIMADEWDRVHGLMREFRVQRAVIDYFPQPTEARKFAKRFPGFVYLCQYVNGTTGREVRTDEDDYGSNLCKVNKVAWLAKSLGRIMSGDLLLPTDTPQEFEDHVKAPIRTMNKDKVQAEYVMSGPDHYAHALNYAEIALKILDPSLAGNDAIIK